MALNAGLKGANTVPEKENFGGRRTEGMKREKSI